MNDFRLVLQQELVDRCRKNASYSLRAFAKSLDIAPSALSDMLNGKRPITPKTTRRLGLSLGFPLPKIQSFIEGESGVKTSKEPDFAQITLDTFALMSDWYHYAILELMKVRHFKSDAAWIAKTLGVSKNEINAAVERLTRLGLIEIDAKGKWRDTSDGFSTNISTTLGKPLTTASAKKLQTQILTQSIRALNEVPFEARNHTSMTMAIHPKHLPEAVEMIRKFRRKLCQTLETQTPATEVYQLSIALFPITQITAKSKNSGVQS